MKYEKATCPTCLTSTSNMDLLLAEAAKLAGVELYDFGGGNMVAPVPDIGLDNNYLNGHMVAVVVESNNNYKVTGVKFSYNNFTFEDIVDKLKRAAEHNKTQEKTMEFIQ